MAKSAKTSREPKEVVGDWYDYPQYYDLLCADETDREQRFIEQIIAEYCEIPVKKLLEPGCGSGRLVTALAERGFDVTAIDTNATSLDFLRQRLAKRSLTARVKNVDMSDFSLRYKVDLAYCLMNTFRHLMTEDAAARHLQCVANCLRPGGIYLLGFHVMPSDADDECIERWRAKEGTTTASVTLRVLETDRVQRFERIRINMRVRSRQHNLKLRTEFPLRRYSARQVRELFSKVPDLELVKIFDFWYDTSHPRRLNNDLADAVFVLKKRIT